MRSNARPARWKLAAVIVPLVSAAAIVVPLIAGQDSVETSSDSLRGVPSSPLGNAPSEEPSSSSGSTQLGADGTPDSSTLRPSPSSANPNELVFGEPIGTVRPWSWHEESLAWLLPLSAPLEEFPEDPFHDYEQGCTGEQLAWLKAHARPAETMTAFHVSLQNSASDGGAIALGNVRFEGEEVPSEPHVAFDCQMDERGGLIGSSPILLHTDGRSAEWGWADLDDPSAPTEGFPVTLNLSPGEVAELYFERHEDVDGQRQYIGQIVADVVNEDRTVSLAAADFFPDPVPDYWFGYAYAYDSGDWSFTCVTPDAGPGWPECTVEDAAAILADLVITTVH